VVCSHLEEGYDIYCEEDGSVILDDLDIDGYCNPGETDVLCATGGQGDGQVIQHCSYGCIFATHFPLNDEQVSTLDLEELCLPYDGNDTDAGV